MTESKSEVEQCNRVEKLHHYLETLRVEESERRKNGKKNARIREVHGQCPHSRVDG